VDRCLSGETMLVKFGAAAYAARGAELTGSNEWSCAVGPGGPQPRRAGAGAGDLEGKGVARSDLPPQGDESCRRGSGSMGEGVCAGDVAVDV